MILITKRSVMLCKDGKRIFESEHDVRSILWALTTVYKVVGQFLRVMFLVTSILLMQSEGDLEVMGSIVGIVQLQKSKFQG